MYKKILTLFLLLFLITNTFALTDTNLIGYWKLDETSGTNLVDSKDLDHNLTLNAGTVNQTGKVGKAVSLTNAIAQHANGTISATLTATTQCGWVYPTGGSELGLVYGVGDGDATGNVLIKSDNAGGNGTKIGSFAPGVAYGSVSTVDFDESTWNFICFAKTGTSGKIYKNGSLLATTGNPVDATGVTNYFFGGQGSTFGAMTASYDELSHWNQELTLSEIQELYNSGNGTTYCPDEDGIPPINRFSLTCEYFGIDSNFNSTVNASTATIDFNDTSTGTTIIINDWNWIIDDILESTDQNFTLTGITNNTDYNSCLISSGYEDTNILNIATDSICKTINSGRWYADWNIAVYDESNGTNLDGITMEISNSEGTLEYDFDQSIYLNYDNNLSTILDTTNRTTTLKFTKTGYGTRYYVFDANKFIESDLDINFLMLPEADGTGNVSLTIFDAEGLEIVTNNYVTVSLDSNIVGRRKTNDLGIVIFDLNELNDDYLFSIEGYYDTNLGTVEVLRPKDEITKEDISTNWNLQIVTSNANETIANLDLNTYSALIIPNKTYPYAFVVDSNTTGAYYPRTYIANILGDQNIYGTYTIEPYLISQDDGDSYKVTIKEQHTELPMKKAIVYVYDTESSEDGLITSFQVDETTASFETYLRSGAQYFFAVTDGTGNPRTFSGNNRVLQSTILGEDIIILVDYSLVRTGIRNLTVFPISQYADVNTIVKINADAIINGQWVCTFGTGCSWDYSTYLVEVKVYEDGVLNTSKGETREVTGGQPGIIDYDFNIVLDSYETTYTINMTVDGITAYNGDITTYSVGNTLRRSEAQELLGTANNMITFVIVIVILMASMVIGHLTGYGLESLFIMSIMFTISGAITSGIVLVAVLGVIYFIVPIIRESFKE